MEATSELIRTFRSCKNIISIHFRREAFLFCSLQPERDVLNLGKNKALQFLGVLYNNIIDRHSKFFFLACSFEESLNPNKLLHDNEAYNEM